MDEPQVNEPKGFQFSLAAVAVLTAFLCVVLAIGINIGWKTFLIAVEPVFVIAGLLSAFRQQSVRPPRIPGSDFSLTFTEKNQTLWLVVAAIAIWLPCFIGYLILSATIGS